MNYKELKQIIQKHNQAYYDNSASMITDAEYDQLYDKLENMEKAQGWRDHDSPTKHVGGAAGKVTHPYKLYSLRKIYEGEETHNVTDYTKKELMEFLDSLNTDQFKEIQNFFDTMPKLRYHAKWPCPKCGVEDVKVIEGLTSFFELA